MAKVVTMGEIMLRLSSPGYQRFAQASEFEINYGGAEANVAVSLAQLGHDVTYISKIPSNAIGEAAIATLKKTGVDCRYIARGGKRLGVYFLENGASVRPSNVVYDRADSSLTQASAEEFDFDQIFDGVDLFHVSGITPVLSEETARLTRIALQKAKEQLIGLENALHLAKKAAAINAFGEKLKEKDGALYAEDTELGEGASTITFECTADDKTVTFTVHTDAEFLGDALQENGNIGFIRRLVPETHWEPVFFDNANRIYGLGL